MNTVYTGTSLIAIDKSLGHVLKTLHEMFNYSLLGLVVVHVGAALHHHFIARPYPEPDVTLAGRSSMKALLALLPMSVAFNAAAAVFNVPVMNKSAITFVSSQMGVPVRDGFGKFACRISPDPTRPVRRLERQR